MDKTRVLRRLLRLCLGIQGLGVHYLDRHEERNGEGSEWLGASCAPMIVVEQKSQDVLQCLTRKDRGRPEALAGYTRNGTANAGRRDECHASCLCRAFASQWSMPSGMAMFVVRS
ncbi:hypothetical protein CGRA01v4_12736 [Colletotrichum graminicola]|nr:hypothetical protein CGRA01v4_12736 [Colletotrichum graminicola]